MNPYWEVDFFGFFATLFQRIFSGGRGPWAADEIQIATLGLVALSCGLVGPFLVLKRMTMFANSLSHTILLGISAAYLLASHLWGGTIQDFSTLFIGAFISAILTAVCTEGLVKFLKLQEDASVGLVFTALFALGITVVTLFTRDVHLGIEAVLGNVDLLQWSDLSSSFLVAAINLGVVLLFYRQFQLSCFDRNLAKALGVASGFFHFLLLFLVAAVCIGAFRAVGVVLVLGFLVGPYLTARLFCNRLPWLLFWTPCIGIAISMVGVAFSRHLLTSHNIALSTGGLVTLLIGLFYAASLLVKKCFLRRNKIKLFTPAQ